MARGRYMCDTEMGDKDTTRKKRHMTEAKVKNGSFEPSEGPTRSEIKVRVL